MDMTTNDPREIYTNPTMVGGVVLMTCQYCKQNYDVDQLHTCELKANKDVLQQHVSVKVTRNRDGSLFSLGVERGCQGTMTFREMNEHELKLIDEALKSTFEATQYERRKQEKRR